MARTASLSTLISDVRTKGDFAGATIRHTDAQITRLLNQSIQRFRERISNEGSTRYLVSSTGTLGVGPTSPFPFYQLDLSGLSPALVRTYGIDVTFPGGDVRTLDHVPFEMRAKYGTNLQGSEPQAWAHFKSDQVAILPASSTAYAYTVWYLPVIADLASGSDTFDGVAGWEDFIVWDVVVQLIARDQFPQAYGIAATQRDGVWADILRGATKVSQAGGAHLGRDSFGGKLPLFLGGRRPQKTAAGGPMVPAPGSVTDAMLADMTGPTVKGVLSGTTRPYSVGVATLTTYLSTFSTTQRGLVPPPLGVGGLYLDDSGTWSAPAGGGGGGGSVGPSGAVQYQAGTGMAGASGFRIHGISGPSLVAHLQGTLRVTGGEVAVGSGSTKIQSTGIDAGFGSIVNVGTLVASAIAAPAFTDTAAGLAPASGGGTSNFLRADGSWSAPPAGAGGGGPTMLAAGAEGAIQYNGGSGLAGTDFSIFVSPFISGSGRALSFGLTSPSGGPFGGMNWGNGTIVQGKTASGLAQRIFDWRTAGNAGGIASGAVLSVGNNGEPSPAPTGDIQAIRWSVRPSGTFYWFLGPSGPSSARLMETGLDVRNFHVSARSIALGTGLGLDQLQPVGSGMFLGNLSGTGTPSPVAVATLHAFAPTFTSVQPGTVPQSGGGTANYLRADGSWAVPPGGAATQPSGPAQSVQFRGAAGFEGATGIYVVASGQAFKFGPSATIGHFAPAGSVEVSGTGLASAVPIWAPTAVATVQAVAHGGGSVAAAGLLRGRANTTLVSALEQAGINDIPVIAVNNSNDILFGSTSQGADLIFDAKSGQQERHRIANGDEYTYNATEANWNSNNLIGVAVARVGTLLATGMHVGQLTLGSGLSNANLDIVGSGLFKGRLTGTGTPQDIALQTMLGYAPTFTATKQGVVPPSGGGTTNFLRADGTWTTPAAGAAVPSGIDFSVQFNNGGAFGGATGIKVVGSGQAFAFGAAPASTGTFGGLRFSKFQTVHSRNEANDGDMRVLEMADSLSIGDGNPTGHAAIYNDVRADGAHVFRRGYVNKFIVQGSGIDLLGGVVMGAAAIGPLASGIDNANLALIGSGLFKGRISGTGAVQDVALQTMLGFTPTFTATQRGVVPPSGGGTTNFLRADGTWTTPAGAPATPGGGPNSIQFNDNGTTNGASGYGFSSAGGALGIGVPSFLPGFGDIRVASGFNITGNLPSGIGGVAATQQLFDWSGGGASGVLDIGGASGVLGTIRNEVATGGSIEWLIGGQTGMAFRPTGLDAPGRHINAKSLSIGHINGLPFDFNGLKRGLDIGNSSGLPSGLSLYLPRGAGSGANRYIIASGTVGTGTQSAPRFVTLSPTGGRGGGVIRIERINDGGWPFEVRTPTGTTLHSFPSGTKGWADFMFEKPSGAVFQLAGHADMY